MLAEESLFQAAERFISLNLQPYGFQTFGLFVVDDADWELWAQIYPRSGRAHLTVRKDWFERVHKQGLDSLPDPRTAPRIFVLDATEPVRAGECFLTRAVWTPGQSTTQAGWVAYSRDFWSNGIECYATGATMSRALKRLSRERAAWAANKISPQDAEAISSTFD